MSHELQFDSPSSTTNTSMGATLLSSTTSSNATMGSYQAVLQTDGGARANPGPAGVGFALWGAACAPCDTIASTLEATLYGGMMLAEPSTNNIAEYKALIWGLHNALAHGVSRLAVRADSELMIKQLNGQYRVKSTELKPLFLTVQRLRSQFERITFIHVRREFNKTADQLYNDALNQRALQGIGRFLVGLDGTPATPIVNGIDHSQDQKQAQLTSLSLTQPLASTPHRAAQPLPLRVSFELADELKPLLGEFASLELIFTDKRLVDDDELKSQMVARLKTTIEPTLNTELNNLLIAKENDR